MKAPVVKEIKPRQGISQKALRSAVDKLYRLSAYENRYSGNVEAYNKKMKELKLSYFKPFEKDHFALSKSEEKAIEQFTELLGIATMGAKEIEELNNDDY